MKNSFNKPEAYEKYYQDLLKNMKFFGTLKDIFMLSAVLGYRNGIRLAISKSGGDPIKEHIFNSDDFNIMDIIALETTKDLSIILKENKDEKYKIIEEYAHAGIKYIVENIYIGDVTSSESFIDFVTKLSPESVTPAKTDVTTMISNIVDNL